MTYLRRKIDSFLEEWYLNKQKKPLIIKGARQIGKTKSARRFATMHYENLVEINFVENTQFKTILENGYSVENIIKNITRINPDIKCIPHKTIIFFDEIQSYPDIVTSLKFFSEDGRFDVLCSGSLLGINYKQIESISVGYKTDYEMYSMDFEEFLWAMGDETTMPYVKQCFEKRRPLGPLHRKVMDLFRQYMIVGGMPQAVSAFIENKNFEDVDVVKREILSLYRADIEKYAMGYESKVKSIFDQIPAELQRHEKRFRLSHISETARLRDYESSFLWLSDAKIVNVCYAATEPVIGLKMRMDNLTLKCYMADTGLLISHAFDEKTIINEKLYQKLLLDKLEINKGMLVENIVAQMLSASGHKLYFYSSYSKTDAEDRMEIDFLIRKSIITNRHNICPIEVKSTTKYTITSLEKFYHKFNKNLSMAFVLHSADLKEENGIVYLPLYMTPFL